MGQLESIYQTRLIKKLMRMFPGIVVLKNDEQYIQGFPDLTLLYHTHWAALEVKRSEAEMARPRPNQQFWIDRLNKLSFAAFICPSNEQDVLDALQRSFEAER